MAGPLKWKRVEAGWYSAVVSPEPGDSYAVIQNTDGRKPVWRVMVPKTHGPAATCWTLKEAKAWAQAHYERSVS